MKDLIETIASVTADLMQHVFTLAANGKMTEARSVVAQFEAVTKCQLDADRDAAEDVLEKRFPRTT